MKLKLLAPLLVVIYLHFIAEDPQTAGKWLRETLPRPGLGVSLYS